MIGLVALMSKFALVGIVIALSINIISTRIDRGFTSSSAKSVKTYLESTRVRNLRSFVKAGKSSKFKNLILFD